MFRKYLRPRLVWWFFRLWSLTWRITHVEHPAMTRAKDAGEPMVFAHWHGTELCVLPLVTRYRIATMTSTSADGQLIDFVIRRLGGATSHGSSTRGAVGALKGLIKLVGRGYRASMAVDGPRGPIYRVKPGAFELSRLAKARIVPVGAACSNPIVFHKSWNKAQLPKPFSRVVVVFAEPWPIFSRDQDARDDRLALTLAEQISAACQSATDHLRS